MGPEHHLSTISAESLQRLVNICVCYFILFQAALFWGDNDPLVAESDLDRVRMELPNVVLSYKVPWKGWNHLDFLFALDADKYQNIHILKLLKYFPII